MSTKCCKGGSYNGHAHGCNQPGYNAWKNGPPLPGHPLCPCYTAGGSPCWRGHGDDRDRPHRQKKTPAQQPETFSKTKSARVVTPDA